MADREQNFMESPLFIWIDTFRQEGTPALQYRDIYDGVFLSDVMQQIDPRPAYQKVTRLVKDINIRLQNWDVLMKNIRAYYQDVLQQLLIMKLPNIQTICREPEKEAGHAELKKALKLILGCAVQCERKEYFIGKIKGQDIEVQQEIVEYIKEITDDTVSVFPMEQPTYHLEQYTEKMFNHLIRLIKERDEDVEVITDLILEKEYFQSQAEGTVMLVTPPDSPEKHHLVVEIADAKAKIRHLRQELEEKQEQLSDISDELEVQKTTNTKLRNENAELIKDARSARSLRDELDVLREKMNKVNNYEAEILKYKEKLTELEFYKTRVEELREDNAILIETKGMLEEQLNNTHKRVETVIELEQELLHYREQTEELNSERDADRERIRLLMEENAQLQFEKKSSMNESTNLEQELEATKSRMARIGGSLSEQIHETTNAKILRLELENQRLQQRLEDMRESALIENTTLNLQLEKENQRLLKKIDKLQETMKENQQKCIELEEKNKELVTKKTELTHTLEIVKESSDRQIKELERENDDLTQTVEIIRERNEQTNDSKLKDLERENKRLHETVSTKNQQLSKFEFENRQLQKTFQKSKESADKIAELENENANLEKENSELHKKLQTSELTSEKYDKLEQENSNLEIENKKMQRTVQSLQSALQKKEQLEQEHINLTVENQKLQRTLESMKESSTKIVELENEKDLLNREIQQLRRSLEAQKSQRTKLEHMELDLMDLDNENQKLQKTLEITTKRVEHLEKDNSELESENENLQEKIESMKFSQKRLDELNKDNTELEEQIQRIGKEKSVLEKENKRLKVSNETKETALEELREKYNSLDKDYKNLKRLTEVQKDTSVKVKDMEKEHRDLIQQVSVEKKTVSTLREDLVNEKIKTQQLTNELERLNGELEKIGISREKLVRAEHSHDDSRYKALESMMEEALKKSMEIKEDKINSLESRLEESKNRNLKLQEELRLLKRECESLKQRYEEESVGHEREKRDIQSRQRDSLVWNSPFHQQQQQQGSNNPTKEILELKDHLVKVERMNATLMTENSNWKTQNNAQNERIRQLENEKSHLQSQYSNFHGQSHALQSQNAKLQVENSTLQSQCASLLAQNTSLQNQFSTLEGEHENLKSTHDQLIQELEALKQLHDELSSEYEALISEHGSLKSVHKTIKNENRELQQQLDNFLHGKEDINKLKDMYERQLDQLRRDQKSLNNLQLDHDKLRGEHNRLIGAHDKLETDHKSALADFKKMKTEHNTLQLMQTELQGNYARCKDELNAANMNMINLANKYEMILLTSQKLEEDNSKLLQQVQTLLNNNQDLLTKVLSSKDHFVEEEKMYMEKLADLRRQKERLEDKIMEHYKNREKQKKNRSLGAILVQKARLIMSRSQKSKSRTNLAEASPDNSSMGSGSLGDNGDHEPLSRSKSDKRRRRSRRGSAGNIAADGSPKLSKQNKILAKSTNAINFDQESSSADLRGLGRVGVADDDEGGFRTVTGEPETGEEMLTLEEFLAEGKESPEKRKMRKPLDGFTHEDSESRSSENSDNSARHPLSRKPAPPLPTQLNNVCRTGSIPDVAITGSDLNMTRMSRVSTGSSGSSQDIRQETSFSHLNSPQANIRPDTSTPARTQADFRVRSLEEMNMYSPFQRQINDDHRSTSSSDSAPSPQVVRSGRYSDKPYSSENNPIYYSHSHSHRPIMDRELSSNSADRDKLSPDARLDLLTHGGQPFSPMTSFPAAGWSPAPNFSSPREPDRELKNDNDLSIQSAQGRYNRSPQDHSGIAGSRPMKATASMQSGTHSPGRLDHRPPTGSQVDGRQSTPQRRSGESPQGPRILVSRSQLGPTPYGQKNNAKVARPASAFGVPVNPVFQYNNMDSNVNRDLQGQALESRQPQHTANNSIVNTSNYSETNGPIQSPSNYSRAQRIERPQSVPPNMFNFPDDSHQDLNSSFNSSEKVTPSKGTPPVPPPRRNRDVVQNIKSQYSVLREPGVNSRTSLNKTSFSESVLNNARPMSLAGIARSQTPTSRTLPQPKVTQNKSPAPRPLNNEEDGTTPKENSVCVFTPSIEV
ncbi:hypothetical protein CHS0354_007697 [Potamilus streckersoni]|uniref:HOOK N-terminal domain-containing protein n=1 Tax=Potamilus streckersoni TaxID=2493646 RepID=A0AAE0SH43_9BIVA|nr:hypothetical protein CHS0354_007697 [Potamilus streckersoni]